jgi:hypothetical protein
MVPTATRRVLTAIALLAVVGAACASPAATTMATPAEATPSPRWSATPSASAEAPQPGSASPALPTAAPVGESPMDARSFLGMPINLELTRDCGLCGSTGWLYALPSFRLYADGTAVFRGPGDRATAPYRTIRLGDRDYEELLSTALDDGGLRGAEDRYPGDADDAGGFRLRLHAGFLDQAADVNVYVEPVLGTSGFDVSGDPIKDPERRAQLEAFADVLDDFESWLAARGQVSEPYVPEVYAAAIFSSTHDGVATPWPWTALTPEEFGYVDGDEWLASVSPADIAAAGVGVGGGEVPGVRIGDDRLGDLLIRPVLPGDDRPGMYGLGPDTVATTIEPDIRVRSLPAISDESRMLTPLLQAGDDLYIISGPVQADAYRWYEVHVPRRGLTGWVAAAAKTGEPWLRPAPLDCVDFAGGETTIDLGEVESALERLACFGDAAFSGVRLLRLPEGEGLRCPDALEWFHDPEWLDSPLSCGYEFHPEAVDTGGGVDFISAAILHPSIGDVPGQLLADHPHGLLVDVTGTHDHPDARDCRAVGGADLPPPSLVRLECRTLFVITSMHPFE